MRSSSPPQHVNYSSSAISDISFTFFGSNKSIHTEPSPKSSASNIMWVHTIEASGCRWIDCASWQQYHSANGLGSLRTAGIHHINDLSFSPWFLFPVFSRGTSGYFFKHVDKIFVAVKATVKSDWFNGMARILKPMTRVTYSQSVDILFGCHIIVLTVYLKNICFGHMRCSGYIADMLYKYIILLYILHNQLRFVQTLFLPGCYPVMISRGRMIQDRKNDG